MQAAQVRKSSFVDSGSDKKAAYHPETHHSCTVHAGTVILQVSKIPPLACISLCCIETTCHALHELLACQTFLNALMCLHKLSGCVYVGPVPTRKVSTV